MEIGPAGGLVGGSLNGGTNSTSFWNIEASGQNTSVYGVGLTDLQMHNRATFIAAGWDFKSETSNGSNDYWNMDGYNYYGLPYLFWQSSVPVIWPSPNNLSFGPTHVANPGIQKTIEVQSPGVQDLIIDQISLANGAQGFSIGSVSLPITLHCSESITLTITYDPVANGNQSDELRIHSNAGNAATMVVPLTGVCQTEAYAIPPVGSGTESDPYLIASLYNLRWLSDTPSQFSAWYRQTADINASETATWNSEQGWNPIGSSSETPFRGHYNGEGYKITGLTINRPSSINAGLFGETAGAQISDVVLTEVSIQGYLYVGGLIGHAFGGSTTRCSVSGSVAGDAAFIGGIIGAFDGGNLSLSCADVNVTGGTYSGGLAGFITSNGTAINCYATGDVTGAAYAGGLIGLGTDPAYNVTNCYASGAVSSPQGAGGLGGSSNGPNSHVTNSFWNTQTSGLAVSCGGTGITSEQMRAIGTFTAASWDFAGEAMNGTADYWNQADFINNGFPFLSWQRLGPAIQINPTQVHFATTASDQANVQQNVVLHNIGYDALSVTSIHLQDGSQGFGLVIPTLPYSISVGDSLTITVVFTPNHGTDCADNLIVASNAVNGALSVVPLTGIFDSSAPCQPANISINLQGTNVHLTWDPVTETINGTPMTPLGYAVLFSEAADASAENYYFHGIADTTEYIHRGVLGFSNRMFYRVIAITNIDLIRGGNETRGEGREELITWGELKARKSR